MTAQIFYPIRSQHPVIKKAPFTFDAIALQTFVVGEFYIVYSSEKATLQAKNHHADLRKDPYR